MAENSWQFWGILAAHWGWWPAAIMALSQWHAAQLLDIPLPPALTAITLAGTMAIYGLDRWAERLSGLHTENRHHLPNWLYIPVWLFIAGLALYAVPSLARHHWVWLAGLSAGGLLYLGTIAKKWHAPIFFKELLGAACFTVLAWGGFGDALQGPWPAFYLMGFSNFLWSAQQDRHRDGRNHMKSPALRWPQWNQRLARITALSAASLFWFGTAQSPIFAICAALHGLWPSQRKWPIDLAFLPLLALFWLNA